MTPQQRNKKRYNLHYAIRRQGYTLVTDKRTVYVQANRPIPYSRQLLVLTRQFGYAIQQEIPTEP